MKEKNVNTALEKLIGAALVQFKDSNLNSLTCTKIYEAIFNSLTSVFENSQVPLTNESMNYVAQQYYDSILINNTQELDPNIFTERAKLENISTKELAFLAVLLQQTDFRKPILDEIKKRS
jgi:hypothetical protein